MLNAREWLIVLLMLVCVMQAMFGLVGLVTALAT